MNHVAEQTVEERKIDTRKKLFRWGWILLIFVVYVTLVVYVNVSPSANESISPALSVVKGTDLPQVFNPNANWKKLNISSQKVLRGSYSIQGSPPNSYVWVGKNASMTIFNTKTMNGILIKGYIPFDVEKKGLPANHAFMVKILINNSVIRTVTTKTDQSFTEQISRGEIEKICGKAASFQLYIKSNVEIEPYKYGLNSDKRQLSLIIDYIGVQN